MVGVQQPEAARSSNVFGVSVNVKLCGSIPRKDILMAASSGGAPCSLNDCLTSQGTTLTKRVFASTNGSTDEPSTLSKTSLGEALSGTINHNTNKTSSTTINNTIMVGGGSEQLLSHQPPLGLVLEPPSWAVPARGESRLEPVCDSVGRQSAVDLTGRACFRVGRSPNMDIQLLHATSSRRHALLFHHSNGSCYVVDCGSAHGTFVNGVRIASPSSGGVVIPHKVKRGALIRFGGPGAPCFLLKSFSFLLNELDEVLVAASPDTGELVRRNTRLNALGRTAGESLRESVFMAIDLAPSVSRKRSFDSLDSRDYSLDAELCGKRMRCCSSPPPSPEEPPLRLVSPDLPSTIAKRVTFSSDPPRLFYPALVTPEELSSGEEDNNECS